MAVVVRDAFSRLRDASYQPTYPAAKVTPAAVASKSVERRSFARISVSTLIDAELLQPGTTLTPAWGAENGIIATVTDDGQIALEDEVFGSPSGAAKEALGGTSTNGWEFWVADTADGQYSLAELRNIYAEVSGDAP